MAAAVVGAGGALAQAPADKYPEKPIKIIVPFAPGGSVDILARVIGQKLTENWRQPVIVESRPGAGTMVIRGEIDRWSPVIKKLGLKAE